MMRWQSTIRARLTLLYAGAFFITGALLVVMMYMLLGHFLDQQLSSRMGVTEHLESIGGREASTEVAEELRTQFVQDHARILQSMLIWSLVALSVISVLAGAVGWFLAGRVLRPLQTITATARRVAERSMHERIALEGPRDEIKNLADTFDAMLERLDRAFEGQRRFVDNASHELRTPLTINRTLMEVALDDPHTPPSTKHLCTTLLEVNQRHERLIEGLLVLASSDEQLTERTPVDLANIAQHVTTVSQDAAHKAGLEIRAATNSAPATGDPVLLERLVQNLLDNAIRYNASESGWISIETGCDGEYARLSVENTGPTVPAFEVEGLFEPFRRAASSDRLSDSNPILSRRGAGLGLSIVRSIAQAHHGEVHAEPRPGGGLKVTVRIAATTPTVEPSKSPSLRAL